MMKPAQCQQARWQLPLVASCCFSSSDVPWSRSLRLRDPLELLHCRWWNQLGHRQRRTIVLDRNQTEAKESKRNPPESHSAVMMFQNYDLVSDVPAVSRCCAGGALCAPAHTPECVSAQLRGFFHDSMSPGSESGLDRSATPLRHAGPRGPARAAVATEGFWCCSRVEVRFGFPSAVVLILGPSRHEACIE